MALRSSCTCSTATRSRSAGPRPSRSSSAGRCLQPEPSPPSPRTRPRPRPAGPHPGVSCESSSRALLPDLICVLRPPREADPFALLRESVLRGRLEVLPDDDELAARIEVDEIARDHADVDDLAHGPGLAGPALVAHPDLLRADREAPPVALEDVGDA